MMRYQVNSPDLDYLSMLNINQTSTLWTTTAPEKIILATNQLHVWQSDINITKIQAGRIYSILSKKEKARASRFKFEEHRLKFIAARATLRKILSHYLSIDPNAISFTENKYGKPGLKDEINKSSIFFNISHSHNMALFAISNEENIGIDIEAVNRKIDFDEISKRFFSDRENEHIQALPISQKSIDFYKIWTAKEAFIKAIGQGLSFPLKEFEISLNNNTISLASIYGDPNKASTWNLFKYDVPDEYESSIAIQAERPDITSWKISI